MSTAKDPYESYLQRASQLFDSGDVVKAGQIWQAILKKNPDHEAARAGLYRVKQYFDARATQDGLGGTKRPLPAEPAPSVAAMLPELSEIPKLLEQGCVLYDSGHVEDAIGKWDLVLQMDPGNAMAKGYINGAKRTQGHQGNSDAAAKQIRDTADFAKEIPVPEAAPVRVPPVQAAPVQVTPVLTAPPPPPAPAPAIEVDVEKFLRDGCTLYDMGQVEDALKKWERALIAEPSHALARTYVRDARKELGLPPLEENDVPTPPQESEVPEPVPLSAEEAQNDEHLEQLIREGVQLFDMGMTLEAIQKWKQVLVSSPGHQDAKAYLVMAERELNSTASAPTGTSPGITAPAKPQAAPQRMPSPALEHRTLIEMVPDPSPAAVEPPPSTPVAPPKALTAATSAPARKGLEMPRFMQGFSLPSWMNSPRIVLGAIVGIVVLIAGGIFYHKWKLDSQLRESVAAYRAEALMPVARNVQITSLEESPENILKEAERALGEDPLISYFRTQELIRINPSDGAAIQLLERARAELVKIASSSKVTLKDYEQQLQQGDLDSANKTIAQLLAQLPEDPALKERAARLFLALAQIHATKERWQDAEDCLKRGRALFPSDKSWNARLKLLENLHQMPKNERPQWVQLLG